MADTSTYASRLNSDEKLPEMLSRHRKEGAEFWRPQWDEFARLQRFANQDHWPKEAGANSTTNDQANNPNSKSPRLIFDRISPIVQTASGRQIINRFERAYLPRHPAMARQAEIMTSVDRALMQATDDEQVTSAAFKDGPIIQGVSCVRWEMDTLGEKGGGIIKRHLPMWQVLVDPDAREINYGDRGWHRYGSWWPQSEVKARWPDKYDDLTGSVGGSTWAPDESHESSRIPWTGMGGNKPFDAYYPKGRCLWVEYEEWREVATYYEVGTPVDPTMSYADALGAAAARVDDSTPDPMTVTRFDTLGEVRKYKEEREAVFSEQVPKQFIVPKQQIVYKYAYQCGDIVLETDLVPTGYWTFQFMTGFRFPQPVKTLFKSLVSRLVDPQKWINVFMSALIRNLQISPKGLLFVEEGFFKNRGEAMSAWASPGGLIQVRRGALQGQPGYKFESGGTSPYAGMVSDLLAFYKDALPEIAGFNPGALGQLGSDLRRISGEVLRQVGDAAMTSNAEPFDSLRLYSREGGRIFLSFLNKFFEVEDVIQIIGEDEAYETVMEPVPPQPVIDPATGQPAIGADGQPVTQPALDPMTGEQLMQPQVGMDGQPVKMLAVPDKGMWAPSAFKEIAVEDIQPVGDQQQAFWKSVETSMPMMLQPQPDTGLPVFNSEDIVEMVPGLTAAVRTRILQRIKMRKTQAWRQQQLQAQQAQSQPPAQGAGSNTNGSGAEQAA